MTTTIQNVDLSKMTYVDGDFIKVSDYSDYIEDDTRYVSEESSLYFETEDEVCIEVKFEQSFSGYITGCPGDYWTPACYETVIEDENVSVFDLLIDGVSYEMTKEIENFLTELVEKQITKK
jgi:hypothetical protein